jgi:AbrB family looped-hinge helix DNA binding protein
MTTTLSSKGQVVLPRQVRTKLGLRPGMQFDVNTHGESVVLVPRGSRKIVRPKRDRKTGLPTFPVPSGAPVITSEWVREQLADFP